MSSILTETVRVTGFHPKTNLRHFKEFFHDCGRIRSCIVKRKYADFDFRTAIEAEEVVLELNNKTLLGKTIKLELVTEENARRSPRGTSETSLSRKVSSREVVDTLYDLSFDGKPVAHQRKFLVERAR
ncbi:hypothetical protein Zmor_020726 [Zophobas morio]|uniref:RRM domain-containing protein n=1 Tax=Zophobas morio TaxID=2755281 RepID=A0AA38I497_9CUCU|nr:hypothetical protein Zmor_020726 [Zophobas morio]